MHTAEREPIMANAHTNPLSYTISGAQEPAAPTMFLLHGMGGGHWVWRHQTQAIAGWRLVAVDLAGHGASPRRRRVARMSTCPRSSGSPRRSRPRAPCGVATRSGARSRWNSRSGIRCTRVP